MRILLLASLLASAPALAAVDAVEITKRSAEQQVRNLLEPVLQKFCREECKLLSVDVTVDVATPDEIAPGFEDMDPRKRDQLVPAQARAKLLIDQKVGTVSRGKLVELLEQYLDTLEYPVKIDQQVAQFPLPLASAARVADMREKILKQFNSTMEDLFQQFCPEQCMLGDLSLKTEVVNGEETSYGGAGEFVQDGDIAIRIRELSASIMTDESLSPEERANLMELARLKTNYLKNVTLDNKTLRFPRGVRSGQGYTYHSNGPYAVGPDGKPLHGSKTSNESKSESSLSSKSLFNNTSNTTDRTTANNNVRTNDRTNTTANNNTSNSENNLKQERFERFEKIERVENGDAVQKELEKFKFFGLIFACSILSLLIFVAVATMRPRSGGAPRQSLHKYLRSFGEERSPQMASPAAMASASSEERSAGIGKRYEIERLIDELMAIYAQQPKVAKHVFTRVLTEDGVEITAHYIHIFGESVVIDMLRDASLQSDMHELMEFYAKNSFEITEDEKLELLRKLHNRTIASKLAVLGNRASTLFEFLTEMDALQIMELIRNESLTIKAIALTQCDPQKRAAIYAQLDENTRMTILTELSRIDYLPRDYIYNVANALKRKRRENPKLNTEALPGSEVLVSLLERTTPSLQRVVIRNLEAQHPDSARAVKQKLVCLDTLRFLRDNQLLEVVLSLRHDELLVFLKGVAPDVRQTIFAKSPKELIIELEEELGAIGSLNRDAYQAIERKVINRMKLMANDGLINLVETNERMFAESRGESTGFVEAKGAA
ncbi:MAG TPA: FliG C-terminal domain-containing protein [Bdellovibrionota bacterium]|nr:FliG C-terminal domain-containing protein [Bdellovibrionota bacterium]